MRLSHLANAPALCGLGGTGNCEWLAICCTSREHQESLSLKDSAAHAPTHALHFLLVTCGVVSWVGCAATPCAHPVEPCSAPCTLFSRHTSAKCRKRQSQVSKACPHVENVALALFAAVIEWHCVLRSWSRMACCAMRSVCKRTASINASICWSARWST